MNNKDEVINDIKTCDGALIITLRLVADKKYDMRIHTKNIDHEGAKLLVSSAYEKIFDGEKKQ